MGHRAGLDLSPQSPGLQRGQVPGQHPFFPGQIQRRGSEVRLGGVIWECHRLVSECQLCSRVGLTPAQGTRSPLGGLGDHRAADAAPSPSEGAPPRPLLREQAVCRRPGQLGSHVPRLPVAGVTFHLHHPCLPASPSKPRAPETPPSPTPPSLQNHCPDTHETPRAWRPASASNATTCRRSE